MTDKEIFKAALEKVGSELNLSYWKMNGQLYASQYYHDIFSHSFAKAFWGERFINYGNISQDESQDSGLMAAYIDSNMKIWQYHLQQMVLEENPLKYLEKFL